MRVMLIYFMRMIIHNQIQFRKKLKMIKKRLKRTLLPLHRMKILKWTLMKKRKKEVKKKKVRTRKNQVRLQIHISSRKKKSKRVKKEGQVQRKSQHLLVRLWIKLLKKLLTNRTKRSFLRLLKKQLGLLQHRKLDLILSIISIKTKVSHLTIKTLMILNWRKHKFT